MLTENDLMLLSSLIDKKFDEKLAPIQKDIAQIKEDVDILKEDMVEVKGMVNILSQWADAATEYHIHEIHYPLHDDEIVK